MKFNNLIAKFSFIIFLIASVHSMERTDGDVDFRKPRRSFVPRLTFMNAFDYSIGIIEVGGGDISGIIEERALRTLRNALNIGVITQDELDSVLYKSLQNNLLKLVRCVLTADSTKPSQSAIDVVVGFIFDSQVNLIYRARVSHLFMQVASSGYGSAKQINLSVKKHMRNIYFFNCKKVCGVLSRKKRSA